MKTQRLCVYTRAWQSGGAGLFAQELVGGLLDNGADVTFVAPMTHSTHMEAQRARLTRVRPPREIPGKGRMANRIRGVLRIVTTVSHLLRLRLTHRVYIVTIPDVMPVMLPTFALLRLTGARIIFVAHDPLPHAWKLGPALRWLERGAHGAYYRLASSVAVLSEPSRAKMREAFPDLRTSVDVIEHGVFVMGKPAPIAGQGVLLLFGTLRRNKGILEGMEGALAARDAGIPVKLIVAGGVHREERDYATALSECAAKAPEAIDLRMGYADDDAVRDLLAQSDALLLPYTDFHSQSGVALLAASNARPIIASAAGGIGALMAEGMPSVTIAQPVTAQSVAAAITTFFATSASEWNEKAQRYLNHTLEVRSWKAIGKQYLEVATRIAT
ncbi:MAG: glycosyltransferase family 4 protein [Sphingobium sp.]